MAIEERVADTSVSSHDDDEQGWSEEARALYEKEATDEQALLAALTAVGAVSWDAMDPDPMFGYRGPLEELVERWRLPVSTPEVGVPVIGPVFVQIARKGIDPQIEWVPASTALVLSEQVFPVLTEWDNPVRAKLEEWGDLAAMTREQILAQADVIRFTHHHRYAQVNTHLKEFADWLKGWDAATRVVEAKALLNGDSGVNGHKPGHP